VVLTPRRWRQVRGVASARPGLDKTISADDGGKRARSPGRARHKPLKPLRAGMPGDSGVLVVTRVLLTTTKRTRGRGCSGHPAFPTPSIGREILAELGRIVSRGRERTSGTGRLKIELGARATNSASSRTSAARSGTHNHRCPCYARLGLQFHPTANIGGYGSRPSPGRRKSPNGLTVIAKSGADEPIHAFLAARWIASRSISSGAPSRDAVVRHDGKHVRRRVTLRYPPASTSHTQDIDVPSRSRRGNGLGFYPTG
jgi:hypothetical protein